MSARPAPTDASGRDRAGRHAAPARRSGLRALAARRWSRAVAAVTATIMLMAGSVTVAMADPEREEQTWKHEFLVDSLLTTADASPGDGVCATATGECTLRAAIEESNALDAAPGEVRIGVAEGLSGNITLTPTRSTWMFEGNLWTAFGTPNGTITEDYGAVFNVVAPVEIDLDHRITATPANDADTPQAAVFLFNGPDITLRGLDQAYGGETTFYVGPSARDVHITDGRSQTPNYHPERFVVVRGGAANITVSNYLVSGYASNTTDWGWGWVDGATAERPVEGHLTLDNVTYTAAATGACGNPATGCSSSPMRLGNQARGSHVNELRFTNNTVENFQRAQDNDTRLIDLRRSTVGTFVFSGNTITAANQRSGRPLIEFGESAVASATVGEIEIVDNVFTGLTAASNATDGVIRLPYGKAISGGGLIARNHIQADTGPVQAIYWQGSASNDNLSVEPSNVVIEDNAFTGFGSAGDRSTIRLYRTGAVTVQRNTFAAGSGSQTNTVAEEAGAADAISQTLVNNRNLGANGKLNTWFPTARTAENVQAEPLGAQRCTVELEVSPPSGAPALATARNPGSPTRLDLYWTESRSAEVYLDSVTVDAQVPHTFSVEIPRGDDERLAHLPEGAVVPVDPETGDLTGGLRLQTQDLTAGDTTASSQFSRVVMLGGTCGLELTIDQAEEQNDPTLARDLHYTLVSSMPLDPASVTPDSIVLTAEATEDTIDESRLNPRVVSAEAVPGTEDTEFTVVARVDDSALVRAEIPAGTLLTTQGETHREPASSTDAEITFVNPLVVAPARLLLVTGEGQGEEYTISTRAGAPVTQAELRFTTTLDEAGEGFGLTLDPGDPRIEAGADSTDPVTVEAPQQDVEAGTPTRVGHEVTSDDTNYDGLVVPHLDVLLFTVNPFVDITKRAYVDVGDPATPETVVATGTEVLAGSRLDDGQPVCWVYTVVNTSADDWATSLSGVEVRDSDTRLGVEGLIGTLPELGVGDSFQLHGCAVLIPSDTRSGA